MASEIEEVAGNKQALLQELRIKAEVSIDGVTLDESARRALTGASYQEQVHSGFEMDMVTHVGQQHPAGYRLPTGLKSAFKLNPRSRYRIVHNNNQFLLTYRGQELLPIEWFKRPAYYALNSSDGVPLKNIATFVQDSNLSVFYSNECNYKKKGEDCLFCNVNATHDTYSEAEGIQWKTPSQAAEAVRAAYQEGIADHVTITGGIIDERREVEYYLDVAEAIQNKTGLQDFDGTAVIAAPLDLSHIDRLKEAGYRTIALNIEVWNKDLYEYYCPGKARNSGGWDHWLKAIEYAVGVFGFGRVRSNIVAGLDTKESTLAGVAWFSDHGVVCLPGAWCPNPGSALEGHRTPEIEWHLDLSRKAYQLQKRAGITYEQVHDASNNDLGLARDIWKIEEGRF